MTPQQAQMLQEVYDWVQARKQQQIAYPLDEASEQTINEKSSIRPLQVGSASLTQSYTVVTGAITGPKAYAGTEIIIINGRNREIPFL